ncbi:hypothetical protein [Paenarthrobacter nicotinovorans]|uniref:hypothetical protein n=1 Tax=Paenarthrobacter nicotinovorans TaxID=29320 RepID=UPI0027D812C6|nr:hypothetical protein [Paenarthrobacter nicotinovorans]
MAIDVEFDETRGKGREVPIRRRGVHVQLCITGGIRCVSDSWIATRDASAASLANSAFLATSTPLGQVQERPAAVTSHSRGCGKTNRAFCSKLY